MIKFIDNNKDYLILLQFKLFNYYYLKWFSSWNYVGLRYVFMLAVSESFNKANERIQEGNKRICFFLNQKINIIEINYFQINLMNHLSFCQILSVVSFFLIRKGILSGYLFLSLSWWLTNCWLGHYKITAEAAKI